MMGIMHCPSKKGTDVSNAMHTQLARLGGSPFDVVACTGDGGGDNEGIQGMHAHFEDMHECYVRRMCLPHISWMACDQSVRSSELDCNALSA